MDASFQSALDPKDTVLWHGKPNPAVSQMNTILMLVVALGISIYLFTQYGSNPLGSTALTGKTAAYALSGIALLVALIAQYAGGKAEFAITQSKVILKTGVAGTRFDSIDLEKIKEVTVTIGPIQNRLSCGTLGIDSGKTRTVTGHGHYRNDAFGRRTFFPGQTVIHPVVDQLIDVDHPHEVHRMLMDAIEKRKVVLGTQKPA